MICTQCKMEIPDGAKMCGHCRSKVRSASTVWGLLVVAVVLYVLVDMLARPEQVQPINPSTPQASLSVATTQPDGQTQLPGSSEQRNFLGAALSYLKTANEQGTRVAAAMAGAANGSTTLGEIRDAMRRALSVENAGYQGDYIGRIRGAIPAEYAPLAKDIDEVHRLFRAGLNETLEYWKDSNESHIASGQATFKRSVVLMNQAISATGTKMGELR